jgi:hypothetical protein
LLFTAVSVVAGDRRRIACENRTMINGLFKTHVNVRDLERSIAFYRDVLELDAPFLFPNPKGLRFWNCRLPPEGR